MLKKLICTTNVSSNQHSSCLPQLSSITLPELTRSTSIYITAPSLLPQHITYHLINHSVSSYLCIPLRGSSKPGCYILQEIKMLSTLILSTAVIAKLDSFMSMSLNMNSIIHKWDYCITNSQLLLNISLNIRQLLFLQILTKTLHGFTYEGKLGGVFGKLEFKVR